MKVKIGKVKKDGTQKVEVKIDPWDTWNCDTTLMHIIHPLLKRFKEIKSSIGAIDKEDVPEYLHKYYKQEEDDEFGVKSFGNKYCIEAYNWVIDEIIWATQPDWDDLYGWGADLSLEDFDVNQKRQNKAMELFGKYFFTFWD